MLHKILGSRAFMSVAGAAVAVILVVVGYFIAFDPAKKTQSYCAIMPDSVGLYVGNQVTMRGIPVGKVTSIANQGKSVKVEFAVEADKPVYADAGATTLSESIVAARELAVVSSGKNTARWNPAQCITKTLTPKSVTETLNAVAQLSKEIDGADSKTPNALAHGLSELNEATAGTGPQINQIIKKLSGAMASPDADIGHLVGVFDAFASVGKKVEEHWGDIESMFTRLAPVLIASRTDLLEPGAQVIDGLAALLPVLNDLTTAFGDPILKGLDVTVPLVKFLRARVGSLAQIVAMTPVLTDAFRSVGQHGIAYAPPKVALPQPNAEQICAAVNAMAPGRCTADGGLVKVDMAALVFGLAGAR
ncbi:MlaD family protein [Nocardia sp. CDC159]|uniref:MlaD family protein n=1 Tax=Nocardia pulmonis TaxID=2951408 RepID=A0A9X2EC43_9NOCA|nr:MULTISPECIES: MlaD family protein [Nocardia]MCM6778139.1 MlaD family protein [Nocardia pulmonis]MCM6791028.1 MlaD family protein [Nocardia sp. CDC159]